MQNVKLLLGTLVLTLLLVFGVSWMAENWLTAPTDSNSPYQKTATQEQLLTETPHVLGASESAKFTIVEFSDYLCPACGTVSPQLEAITRQYPDDVRMVYRHFPLSSLHPNAYMLAEISEAAALQDKFWEMNDYLFDHQPQLNGLSPEESLQYILDNAQEIGIDVSQLQADLDSGEPKKLVEEDLRQAEMLSLTFTPSVFLNGELMPIDQVQQTILSELSQ